MLESADLGNWSWWWWWGENQSLEGTIEMFRVKQNFCLFVNILSETI